METVRFCDTLNFDDGSIEIKYKGVPLREDSNENEVRRMLRDFVDNHKHDDMLENVTILRTIFRDYMEVSLDVYFCDKNGSEFVQYDKSQPLFLFKKVYKKFDGYNTKEVTVEYNTKDGISLNYSHSDMTIVFPNKRSTVTKEIDNIMQYIDTLLTEVKAITLNDDDKALIEIYKLFYKENPDFSSKDINVKVQTMMSILAGFNVTLDCDYSFSLMTKLKMPFSLKLEEMVQKMYSFGVVDEVKDNVKLAEEPKKIIEIVGNSIRESISDEDNMNEALITISKVIHASRYNLSSDVDISEIAEFTNRSVDDVEVSVQLVKRIEHKINKEN